MSDFRRLAPGVYVFIQPPLLCYSSAGVIIGPEDVIVIDSLANAAMARNLRAAIRQVTPRPIRFLINTHAHFAHIYTNHLFPEATVISTHRGRAATATAKKVQGKHDALFASFFNEIDLTGGRYTLQDMSFSGSLSIYQGEREVRLLELGPGHSESDLVVHLPKEKIVFCGDVFLNGLPPLPGEGSVTRTIANYKAIEALEADIYVAGHGDPGTLPEVRAQRILLERLFERAQQCFERGLNYDAALQTLAEDGLSLDFQRLVILSSYSEFSGTQPESTDPAGPDHLTILQSIAAEAKLLLSKKC